MRRPVRYLLCAKECTVIPMDGERKYPIMVVTKQKEGLEERGVMDPYTELSIEETKAQEAELASIYERMVAVNDGVKKTLLILDQCVGASAS